MESKRFPFVADDLVRAPQWMCRGGVREVFPLSQGTVRLSRAPTNSLQEWGIPPRGSGLSYLRCRGVVRAQGSAGEGGGGRQQRCKAEDGGNRGHGCPKARSERTPGRTDALARPFAFAALRGGRDGTCRAGGCRLRGDDATSTFWGRCPEKSHVPTPSAALALVLAAAAGGDRSIGSCGLWARPEAMGAMHLLPLKLKSALNLPVLFPVSSQRSSLLLRRRGTMQPPHPSAGWGAAPPTLGEARGASKSHLLPGQEGVFPFFAKTGHKNGAERAPGGLLHSAGRVPCGGSPDPPIPLLSPCHQTGQDPLFWIYFCLPFPLQ